MFCFRINVGRPRLQRGLTRGVTDTLLGWETVFKYYGLGRLRTRLEVPTSGGGSPPPPSSPPPGGTNYLYDGWRVI